MTDQPESYMSRALRLEPELEKAQARIAELTAQAARDYETLRDRLDLSIQEGLAHKARAEKAEAEKAQLEAQFRNELQPALFDQMRALDKLGKQRDSLSADLAAANERAERARKAQLGAEDEAIATAAELDEASADRDRLEERVAHWQEEYRDAISRYQRMIEERNGLRALLEKVEAWFASEDGPIHYLWESLDICDYDSGDCTWGETLEQVRDFNVPAESLGYGTEWPSITLYREILAALADEISAALHPDDGAGEVGK